jgi:hypothetical protein
MITAQYKGRKLQFEKVGFMSSILIALGIDDKPVSLPNNVNMYVQLTRAENCSSKDVEFFKCKSFNKDYIALKIKGITKYYAKVL